MEGVTPPRLQCAAASHWDGIVLGRQPALARLLACPTTAWIPADDVNVVVLPRGVGGREGWSMSRFSHRAATAAGLLAWSVSHAFAQSSSASPPPSVQLVQLDPVVVTANRFEEFLIDVPAFTHVITQEEIRDSGATSVTEAIGKLGNVNVLSSVGGQLGILSTVDLRGFGASARDNTLILVDGLRVSPIDSGSVRWEAIPVGQIDRIEILHGGGSVQYGDKAVGGVINIITRRGGPAAATAAVSVGSFGSAMVRGSVASSPDASSSLDLDLDAARTDGWRENSQAGQGSLRARYGVRPSAAEEVFVEAVYASQSYGMPGGVIGEVNTGDRQAAKWNNVRDKTTTNSARAVVGATKTIDAGLQFRVELSYGDSEQTVHTPFLSAKRTEYGKRNLDFTPRVKKIWTDANESVVGVDIQRASASGQPDTQDRQRADITNQAVYAMHRHEFSRQLGLAFGLRRQVQTAEAHDRFTDFMGVTSNLATERRQGANASDLALSYYPGEQTLHKLYMRVNRSYRFPNTDEFWGFNPLTFAREFNGILKPQFSRTLEIGGSWNPGGGTKLAGSAYRVTTSDEIRYDFNSGTNINAPEILREGLAAQITHRFAPAWSAQGVIAIQRATYNAAPYNGNDVPLVPRTMASGQLSHMLSARTSATLGARFVGRQYYMDDNRNEHRKMPDYLLFDLSLRHVVGRLEIDATVRNLTNEKYATFGGYNTFITLPGGAFTSDYYYYPGDPRSLWLTAVFRFR